MFQFDQSGLSFSDITHYTGNETEKYRTAFVDYFTEIAELLGGVDNSRQLGEDVWEFETKLAHVSSDSGMRHIILVSTEHIVLLDISITNIDTIVCDIF